MKIIKTIKELKETRRGILKSIGFVPTLGGLHDGHLSLIEESLKKTDTTFVSVFLNPTQFNNKKDLETYPAQIEDDISLLKKMNVDFVFTPNYEAMYPNGYDFQIKENNFSNLMEGEKRPGHFDGVLTVVMKLLQLIKPNQCFFGEKDYQQFLLIKKMCEEFFIDSEIIPMKTIREESGLALSSRNRKLTQDSFEKASLFYRELSSGEANEKIKEKLITHGFEVDYIYDYENRKFGAVYLDEVRLIDNVEV